MNQRELNHEKLSAYLDGELPADERSLVEQQLAEKSESRHALDELRALSDGMRDLPRYRLDAGFADRVLAATQTTSVASPTEPEAASTASDEAETVELPQQSLDSAPWRSLVYAGLVVAAAAMVVIFTRFNQPEPIRPSHLAGTYPDHVRPGGAGGSDVAVSPNGGSPDSVDPLEGPVQSLQVNDPLMFLLNATEAELREERAAIEELL